MADPTLSPFVGSTRPPIPRDQLIAEGWLVLVNLDAQRVWEDRDHTARALIGTLVINEINRTQCRSRSAGAAA